MTYLQQALAYGYRPMGKRLNLTETKVLVQIDEVRSDAWTVSGLGKLPLAWFAMKCDVSLRSVERAMADLIDAKVLEHDGGFVHIQATGKTRPWATYRISPDIVGTDTTYGAAEIYMKTVGHGMKKHASAMYRLMEAHPDWTMKAAWRAFSADYPPAPHGVWCRACHDPATCRDCREA